MKLMTKAIEKAFAAQGRCDDRPADQVRVVAKFFAPTSSWTWYATEFDPKSRTFFGYVMGFEGELGYFSLDELESVRGPLGLGIERDLYWDDATTLRQVMAGERR